MCRIGILGGAFDPVHRGHMHMAVSACQYFDLERVWLMPAGHSPNKGDKIMTAAEHRLRMCEIAAEADERLEAVDFEIRRGSDGTNNPEPDYTYRTLERIAKDVGQRLYFIMGGDSLDYFDRWAHPEIICALATILVAPRDEFDIPAMEKKIAGIQTLFPCDIQILPCTPLQISSTRLREQLKRGEAGREDFPPGVFEYIRENGLYCQAEPAGKA
ncbi:MAG: nicotinate (nicotinamide) nucleotide adenylyltransferase [Muribaculaceae bacterium]|nr:nicotinate (nicotinamide) nucleotide adenylyltransferase [Roseburia sp.]MCM1430366.1 nicotinate (nicotinamide) nucleotide adenylyltransferase [Muribaculaceae bacterium]MCM1492438.1 nicotinate (nicotinamide) nucleotide adenylyltransferase [Muribaculaceae bacterium]